MQNLWQTFWEWYERHYVLNVSIALGLFVIQIIHLSWLGGEVIAIRLFDAPLFELSGIWEKIIVVVDYTEIPAIFTMTLVYVNAWRRGARANSILMLALLHSQWIHIFWITDEFIIETFSVYGETILPAWFAWAAILIDYLEVPVIFDTLRKLYVAVGERKGIAAVKEALDEE
jgi:hypothetical protein